MKLLPDQIFSLQGISSLNVSGRGGSEQVIGSALIPNAERVSAALYDFEVNYKGELHRIEIKKQANDKWFDIGKYHDLSEFDKQVVMLFVLH